MQIPETPMKLLRLLNRAGFRAYFVGGCVRDALLRKVPADWDIATDARPAEVRECFQNVPVVDTGIHHGTVTVIMDGKPFEITTFRVDGGYSDHRRPDNVTFVGGLRLDLARRDFTINAMAYHPDEGLIDPFGGANDLSERRIACVGNPARRFNEDSLRILRAVRFCSTLGFFASPETSEAMRKHKDMLRYVTAERIRAELDKLLMGRDAGRVLVEYAPIVQYTLLRSLEDRIPDLCWEAAARAVARSPEDLPVRLAILLLSFEEGRAVLRELRYDNYTRRCVEQLLDWKTAPVKATCACVRHWLNRLGNDGFQRLLSFHRALGSEIDPEIEHVRDRVLAEGQCYRMCDLAVKGSDLLELKVPSGKRIGILLEEALNAVISGDIPNNRLPLLHFIGREHAKLMEEKYENTGRD